MAKPQKANKQQAKKTIVNTVSPPISLTNESGFSLEEKICTGLLLILIVLVYIIRSKFSQIPFERDEGIYSYFGTLVLEGKTPYIDFYEVKFPGLFYFYGFMVNFFGDTVKGMHTGFMFLNIGTIIILFFASRILFSPTAGLISAITFAFLSMNPSLSGFTVQSEHGVAFFVSLGILFYALSKKENIWYWYLLMGISMASAFLVKTSGVMLCLWGAIIILSDFILTPEKNGKVFFKNILSYSFGGIFMIAMLFLVILKKGAWEEMYYWTYEHSKKYVGAVSLEEGITYFSYTKDAIMENYKLFWIHSLLAFIVCWYKGINVKLRLLGITLIVFSFLTVVPGFYFYGHYFIQVIPGFSIVAGLTTFSVISIAKNYLPNYSKFLPYIYITVFSLLTYTHLISLKSYYLKPNYDNILRKVYGSNPFPEAMEIGKFINANSKPEDNIVLIGSEPQIYFYTKKKSPSRHAYFSAVLNAVPKQKEWQEEFKRDVEKTKPRYFVFFNHPISLLIQQGSDTSIFDWANKYINEHYKLVGLIDMVNGPRSIYKWYEEAQNYKPTSQTIIYIFELK